MLLLMIWAPVQCISKSILLVRLVDKLDFILIKELQPPGLPFTKMWFCSNSLFDIVKSKLFFLAPYPMFGLEKQGYEGCNYDCIVVNKPIVVVSQ